jgi:hypothetical protein
MSKIEITLPQVINLICPRCRLTWMNKNGKDRFYFCYHCTFILFDRQVEALKNNLTTSTLNGIMNKEEMLLKIYNWLNKSWVAFPLMVLLFILFMWLGLKFAVHAHV